MRSQLLLVVLCTAVLAAPSFDKRTVCSHDNCLRAFIQFGSVAQSFCATYLPSHAVPTWASSWQAFPSRVQSACSCINTAPIITSATTTSTTSKTTFTILSTISTSTSTSSSTISTTSTTSTSSIDGSSSSSSSGVTDSSSSSSTASTDSSSSNSATNSMTATDSSSSTSTTSLIISSSSSTSSTSTGTQCTCTAYSQIAPAVASCTAITLQDIYAPPNNSIDLSKVKVGTVITFAGTTTFGFTNSSTFNPMTFGGKGVTITANPDAIIDGNGQAYWDGIGSNGGVPKPDHFIVVSKMTQNSVIQNLHIQNWPTHLFSISSCSDLTFRNLLLDNTAGDAPNSASNGLAAAHNSDGFDLSSSNNTLITDSTIYNQDDCVAITSGNNVTVNNLYCSGGHGLSIGSVGGKSNNRVTNILFQNSVIANSQNGARIKSNYNTTGFIQNITYSNIAVSNISIYGIDVQQDYLNGGPTGNPSNGVIIQNLLFNNITGTASSDATDYYVLCGSGSCSNFVFSDVNITGGTMTSGCNYPPEGCPGP